MEVQRGGSSTQECFQGLREECGDSELPHRTVARWVKTFREGGKAAMPFRTTSIQDDPMMRITQIDSLLPC